MTFADTSALIALFNPRDDLHSTAVEWFKENRPKLILTDYIVDELLTLALARADKQFALVVSKQVRTLFPAGVKKITEEDFNKAWEIFESYQDKEWSLTDCTSYIFIERSGLRKAFAFDPHFDQFGIVSRQPSF
jgi:uncharacterized protein